MTDESGGIGWSAPEMLGEIVRANPDEFRDLIPLIWHCQDEDLFRAGSLWGMYRAAQTGKEYVAPIIEDLEPLTKDPNPSVRGYAVLLADAVEWPSRDSIWAGLADDRGEFVVYQNGQLKQLTVGECAKMLLNKKSK
jgi:hypothetical protein